MGGITVSVCWPVAVSMPASSIWRLQQLLSQGSSRAWQCTPHFGKGNANSKHLARVPQLCNVPKQQQQQLVLAASSLPQSGQPVAIRRHSQVLNCDSVSQHRPYEYQGLSFEDTALFHKAYIVFLQGWMCSPDMLAS